MTGGLVQMIMLLNSREMAVELFDAYAPSLKVSEMDLGRNARERAEILFARLDKFADENPQEHGALFRTLNTIAAVNSDNTNYRTITDFLDHHYALKKVYNSLQYAKMFDKRRPLAMMAAFVAIRTKSGEGNEREDAKKLWETLRIAASKVEQGTFIHKNITPPSFDRAQMSRGLQTFRDELEKYIRTTHQHKNYIAFVIPSVTTEGYVRYYVNTSPPERDVLKVQGDQAVIGVDTNMTGFEIRHFYARDKAWISETKSGDPEHILDLFLKYVLGSEVEKQKRRHCEHRLPLFKYPDRFAEQITLPESSRKAGEKVWISEMEIQVADNPASEDFKLKPDGEGEYTPTVFKGSDALPIHDQIAKQLKERFDPKDWTVLRVELKARLHPHSYDENNDCIGETSDFAEVTFPIKPGGCTPRLENKHKNDRELRMKTLSLRARWKLDGLSDQAYAFLTEKERNGEV